MTPVTDTQTLGAAQASTTKVERWLLYFSALIVLLMGFAWGMSKIQKQVFIYRPSVIHWDGRDYVIRYEDLLSFIEKTRHPIGNGEEIFAGRPEMNYPAPAIFVYTFFGNLPIPPVTAFYITILGTAILGMYFVARTMVKCGIRPWVAGVFAATTILSSYPMWFELDRGNIEFAMWTILVVAMALFVRGRYMSSAVLIALAAAIKPFPLCLLVLFYYLAKKKEIIVALAVWLVVTISCFALTGPTIMRSIAAYRYGTKVYSEAIASVFRPDEMNLDHSVLAIVKQLTRAAFRWPAVWKINPILNKFYGPYMVVGGLVCLVCVFILWRKPLLNQILGVFVLMVIAPPAAYDYTLLHIYIPFALVICFLCCDVAHGRVRVPSWLPYALLGCFAVVFTSQTFMKARATGFGGQFKCLFLMALVAIALTVPMRYSGLEDPGELAPVRR